ncbi:ferric reductase-like transmembrane domain-containing protein [Saccharicrinis fermentans]|nr:ferric reductase-like transmembrane domain-containing protein [Saccharicrinis fermentans]
MMEKLLRKYNTATMLCVFIGLPIAFWALDDSSGRAWVKEAISILTILSFSMMLLQFYLTRSNKRVLKVHRMGKVVKWHKLVGYVFVPILLVHPFLVVVPRYFEAGIDPTDAFYTLITSFNSTGVVLGMIAWCLMWIIALTSLFRNRLAMSYRIWRVFHGILSIVFVVIAAWHVIDLGRHSNVWMTGFIVLVASGGVCLLAVVYFSKSNQGGPSNE